MPKASVEELRGQVAAGQYAVDPGILADDILSKLALIRRVRRLLLGEDEQAAKEAGLGIGLRRQRGAAPATWRPTKPRGDRLP